MRKARHRYGLLPLAMIGIGDRRLMPKGVAIIGQLLREHKHKGKGLSICV